jgi:uncharacterized protein YndB with AHSA1/START domain
MRKHEIQIEIAASPDKVWEALSTGQGISSWFAPIASVEPGVGGKTHIKWAEGMEASPNIEVWEPNQHLRTTSDRPAPAPPNVVDYYIEGSGGTTVMRLVHSGFGAGADFDDEYNSTGGAWPVFLKMMKHSVERGVSSCRNVTVLRVLNEPADAAWEKLLPAASANLKGSIQRHFDPVGHVGCFELPEWGGAMVSIFCEKCGGITALTVANLLYDVSAAQADSVRECWSGILHKTFGEES